MSTTYQTISLEILQNMLEPILGEVLVDTLFREKLLRDRYGSINEPKMINDGKDKGNRMEIIGDNVARFVDSDQVNGNGNIGGSATNGNVNNSNQSNNGTPSANGVGDYFQCSNCDRKIAGSRFAAHIDKCLGGRTRK